MEHWLFRHNKTKEKARLQSVLKLGLKTFTNTWEWRRFCRFLQHGSILKTKSKVSYLLFPCLCQEWTLEISHWQVAWGICISLSSPGMLAVLPNLLFYWIEICSFEIFSWYVWISFYLYYNQLESMPREIAVPSTTRLIKGRDQHYSATTIRALLISSSFLCKHTLIWSELGLYFFPWIYWSQTWCLYWHRAWHGICEDEPQACVLQLGRAREICARIRKNLPPLSLCFQTNKARGKTPFRLLFCKLWPWLPLTSLDMHTWGIFTGLDTVVAAWASFVRWLFHGCKGRKTEVAIHGWHFGFLFLQFERQCS